MLDSYSEIYGAQICSIFTKQVALIQEVIKNEQYSIKPGILYSFGLSQKAKKGIANNGIDVGWENMSGI